MAFLADLLLILVALLGLGVFLQHIFCGRPPRADDSGTSSRNAMGLFLLSLCQGLLPSSAPGQTPPIPSSEKTIPDSLTAPNQPASHPDWQIVQAAIDFMKPLVASQSSTTAQREQTMKNIAEAKSALDRLRGSGTIITEEQELMLTELETLRGGVFAGPPSDREITCYDMVSVPPGEVSLRLLSQKLPLLQKIAQRRTVSREVLEKTLSSIEREFETLKNSPPSDEPEAQQARELIPQIDNLLQELKALK